MRPNDGHIPERFLDQVALVVGSAQGIGKAIARLAREGARLVIADIDEKMMKRTAREVLKAGGSVRTWLCDVRRSSQVERMVQRLMQWYHRIDILMYVAGVGKGVPFAKTDEKLWDWTVDINLKESFPGFSSGSSADGPPAARQAGIHGFDEYLGCRSRTCAL